MESRPECLDPNWRRCAVAVVALPSRRHDLLLPKLVRRRDTAGNLANVGCTEATGITPARAVERLRVEAARRLLSDTRLPSSASPNAAASDRKKRCPEASSACCRRHRRTTGRGSASGEVQLKTQKILEPVPAARDEHAPARAYEASQLSHPAPKNHRFSRRPPRPCGKGS